MKTQATDWEKIFASHISNKILVSRIQKELSKLNSNQLDQGQKNTKKHFTEEDTVKSLSLARRSTTPWTVAYQVPLSIGFSR